MNSLNRFNWIARSYDCLANLVFGNALHRAQMAFVSEIGLHDKVLILGGGTGKFLKDLLAVRPSISVTYIEASSEMLILAKQKVSINAAVNFIHGTHKDIPSKEFDAVVTNFFLDVFREEEIGSLVKTISNNLRVNGKWFVSDFENTDKFSDQFLLSLMYLVFAGTGSVNTRRLPNWRSSFKKEGLELSVTEFYKKGFVSGSMYVKTPLAIDV